MGNGSVSLEKSKDGKTKILVFRNLMGKLLYQGLIIPKISKIEPNKNAISFKFELFVLCLTIQ